MCKFRVIASLLFRRPPRLSCHARRGSNLLEREKIASPLLRPACSVFETAGRASQKPLLAMTPKKNLHIALKRKSGFTLIEIMLVVIILGVLVAMVAPSLFGRGEQAKVAAARADIESNLATALDLYELDNGKYPTSEQGLTALIEKPSSSLEPANWKGPYLKKRKLPIDPWKKEYQYVSPGVHNTEDYDLFSYGPDGVESDDDIVNWTQ